MTCATAGGFLVAGLRHGAGVHDIHVRLVVETDDVEATCLKLWAGRQIIWFTLHLTWRLLLWALRLLFSVVHLFYHAQPLERSHHRHAQGIHGDGLSGGHRAWRRGWPEYRSPATNGTCAYTKPLMITGQSGADVAAAARGHQVSHAARVVAAVPTPRHHAEGRVGDEGAPTAGPGTASGHAMGSVRASAPSPGSHRMKRGEQQA